MKTKQPEYIYTLDTHPPLLLLFKKNQNNLPFSKCELVVIVGITVVERPAPTLLLRTNRGLGWVGDGGSRSWLQTSRLKNHRQNKCCCHATIIISFYNLKKTLFKSIFLVFASKKWINGILMIDVSLHQSFGSLSFESSTFGQIW